MRTLAENIRSESPVNVRVATPMRVHLEPLERLVDSAFDIMEGGNRNRRQVCRINHLYRPAACAEVLKREPDPTQGTLDRRQRETESRFTPLPPKGPDAPAPPGKCLRNRADDGYLIGGTIAETIRSVACRWWLTRG